ncbi:MAG: hypothetical protein WBD40_20360 [Tepidisphaeraceae bacterium]
MSGSDGDTGNGGGGGGGEESVDCANLFIRSTTLSSPDPAVIRTLAVGTELTLRAESERGPLLALTRTRPERVAGSVTSGMLARLLRCIADGYEFVAIVRRIDEGICEVEIRPQGD